MQSFSVLHFLLLNLLQSSVAFHIEISQLLGFSTAVALLHLYIQSKYGELKKRKPLCLNMFYTMINGAKRNHQIKGLCLVFFLILSKYRFSWSMTSYICIYFKQGRAKLRTWIFSKQYNGKRSTRFYILAIKCFQEQKNVKNDLANNVEDI